MEKPIKIIEKNKAGPPELREVVDAERAQVVNGTLKPSADRAGHCGGF